MPIASATQLIEAFSKEAFDDVLGTPESSWLDFKGGPYPVDVAGKLTEKGKWELAKDVGAFANTGHGFLVLGYKTERHVNEPIETAVAHTPIKKSVLDFTAYQDVIRRWLYPRVRNVTGRWFPVDPSIPEGVFLIEVGPQDEADRPILIRRVVTPEGEVKEGGYFAVPVREGDRSELQSAEYVWRLLSAGARPPASVSTPPPVSERAQESLAWLLDEVGWSEEPFLALQAVPPQGGPTLLPGFWDREGLAYRLYRPESLREVGFNLRVAAFPEPVEHGWLSHRFEHHALLLETDGLFTAVGRADPEFLGWAMNSGTAVPGSVMRVNPLTLVEFTLEFFRFIHKELRPRVDRAGWRHRVVGRNLQAGRVVMKPGALKQSPFGDYSPARADQLEIELAERDSPGIDAFEALRHVYGTFGLGEEAIPYSTENAIDEDLIRAAD